MFVEADRNHLQGPHSGVRGHRWGTRLLKMVFFKKACKCQKCLAVSCVPCVQKMHAKLHMLGGCLGGTFGGRPRDGLCHSRVHRDIQIIHHLVKHNLCLNAGAKTQNPRSAFAQTISKCRTCE